MDAVEADEATLRFQLSCKHGTYSPDSAFAQRSKNEAARCVHCGISEKELFELRTAMAAQSFYGIYRP